MEKMLGYARVSTLTQIEGHSLNYQKEAITKYCKANDYVLDKIYVDEGISAYKHRPKFEIMMNRLLNEDDINGVVVQDLTRFGRSTDDLLIQIKTIDKNGKKFISIKDSIDISTKTGRLMLTMLSAIADYEKETIQERMQAGKEYAKVHGTKSGKPMCRPKADINWEQVKELRELGLSWNKTAKQVGVSTPTLIKRAKEEGLDGNI